LEAVKKHIAVYIRVLSAGQDLASQDPDLKRWLRTNSRGRSARWYRDTFTGRTLRRPGMQQLEADINVGRVAALVVWRLDRLGRTAREMLAFLDELETAGVEFVSVRDGVDARSAAGRLMRTILVAFAEYKREVISERVRAGIAKAKSQGKRWGGRRAGLRPKLTPERLKAIRALLAAGTKESRDRAPAWR
jgi:DNA invertase Pin-like site-specific DNA recombinase